MKNFHLYYKAALRRLRHALSAKTQKPFLQLFSTKEKIEKKSEKIMFYHICIMKLHEAA